MKYTESQQQTAFAAVLCFLICAILVVAGALGLFACTPKMEHQVVAPQLDQALDQLKKLKKPCRTIDLMPVPEHAYLIIEGDSVYADEGGGGEQLLRGYVSCRSLAVP